MSSEKRNSVTYGQLAEFFRQVDCGEDDEGARICKENFQLFLNDPDRVLTLFDDPVPLEGFSHENMSKVRKQEAFSEIRIWDNLDDLSFQGTPIPQHRRVTVRISRSQKSCTKFEMPASADRLVSLALLLKDTKIHLRIVAMHSSTIVKAPYNYPGEEESYNVVCLDLSEQGRPKIYHISLDSIKKHHQKFLYLFMTPA